MIILKANCGQAALERAAGKLPALLHPTSNRVKARLLGVLVAGAMGLGLPAHAAVLVQSLDFTAPTQSMWGPGTVSAGFDFTNSVGVDLPLGLGTFSIGYSVGASTGQVNGNFYGNVRTTYTEVLSLMSPTTAINLSYFGDTNGGLLHSTIGAHAQLTSSVGNVGPNFQLDINKTYTPQLPQSVSASNSIDPVARLTLIDVIAASAGVNLAVTETDNFSAHGIDGALNYSRQGSSVVGTIPFTIGTNAGISLPVSLAEAGTWDFWFDNTSLSNTFSTGFDLNIGVFGHTAAGCGFLALESCDDSFNVISPHVFSSSPFALAFNGTALQGFSIEVIPEPATLALLGLGLAGLGWSRRKKA